MEQPKAVSEQEWQQARDELLKAEKEATRALAAYQFMDNGPDAYCPGCTH